MELNERLDIFPNNTRLANLELLQDINIHPATISHEPLPVLTRDGYQEFLVSLIFDSGYDVDFAKKVSTIRLETPAMDKIIRPCLEEKIGLLRRIESKHGIKYDVSRELRDKNINVYAEYFPKVLDSEEKLYSYGVLQSQDLPWGTKLFLTTSKRSIEMLFRNFKYTSQAPSGDTRQLMIVPAKITHQPIYNGGMTPSGFQIDFVYQIEYLPKLNYNKENWLGFSVVNYLQMGRFMKLMNASTSKKLVNKDISVYVVRNPGSARTIVCGIGSIDQYLAYVKSNI